MIPLTSGIRLPFLNHHPWLSSVLGCWDLASSTAAASIGSTCLWFLIQAAETDGEHYWDGGYTASPAIFPLIYSCGSRDVVVVHINPIERPELLRTARDILNRANEISFNSSLMREMRVINFCNDMIASGNSNRGCT